ncbi:MAG: hypothetical protein M1825_005250 [Sarcosagium campestre]|nr:MAG: hypothetical protein M1825_005250 [Sarcosagium campestre]
MGNAGSKAGRAASSTVRKYPSHSSNSSRPPPPKPNHSTSRPSPSANRPQASTTRNEAINLDGSDPVYAASLRSMGVVSPSPTLSHSSTFPGAQASQATTATEASASLAASNPAVRLLRARERLADEADAESREIGRPGHPGRRFLDTVALRQALLLRDRDGVDEAEVERRLSLKRGVLARLGGKGVVGVA